MWINNVPHSKVNNIVWHTWTHSWKAVFMIYGENHHDKIQGNEERRRKDGHCRYILGLHTLIFRMIWIVLSAVVLHIYDDMLKCFGWYWAPWDGLWPLVCWKWKVIAHLSISRSYDLSFREARNVTLKCLSSLIRIYNACTVQKHP